MLPLGLDLDNYHKGAILENSLNYSVVVML